MRVGAGGPALNARLQADEAYQKVMKGGGSSSLGGRDGFLMKSGGSSLGGRDGFLDGFAERLPRAIVLRFEKNPAIRT